MKREDIKAVVRECQAFDASYGDAETDLPLTAALVDLYEATRLFDRSAGPIGAARDRITTLLGEGETP